MRSVAAGPIGRRRPEQGVELLATPRPDFLDRCRWINDGERWDAGDRELVAMRPPVWDSPTTRGLFDTRSRFYWAVDGFSSMLPGHTTDVTELPVDMWEETFLFVNRLISPWHTLVDPAKYDVYLKQLEALDMTVVGSAHGAGTTGLAVARGFELLRQAFSMEAAPLPGQADLEAILAPFEAA